MKRLLCTLSVVSLLMATSCASIVSGSAQKVKFNSSPQNATVLIDGVEAGKTPFETRLARKKEHTVVIQLDGFKPYETKLTKKFNGWYLGNILFGGIIGFVIDPITGAMYNLSAKEINAQLEEGVAIRKTENENVFIAVSQKPNPSWKKVGQLEKAN